MPIEDLARNDVVTADSGTSVVTVAQMMADESVGSVVVTDGDAPVGIVTDRDLGLFARSPREQTRPHRLPRTS